MHHPDFILMKPVWSALVAGALFAFAALRADTPPVAPPGAAHPHLLLTPARLDDLRTRAQSDELMAALLERIHGEAELCLTLPILKNEPQGVQKNILAVSRFAVARITTCALQYRLSGDRRFFDRAREELLAVAAFSDWEPWHFLSTAEMALAVSLGYDWLYDDLSGVDRAAVRDGLRRNALAYAPAAYGKEPAKEKIWLAWGKSETATSNWNQVCNTGLLAAAITLRDESPETFQLVLDGVRQSLPRALANYAPDGGGPEGPIYWAYGNGYSALAMQLLQDSLGTDYGLLDRDDLTKANLARYFLHVFGPTGQAFNYADCDPGPVWDWQTGSMPAFQWMAGQSGLPAAALAARRRLQTWLENYSPIPGRVRPFVFHALWLPAKPSSAVPELPLDAHFRGAADVVFLRSSWIDANGLWVGFKGGVNGISHGQMDLGSFVLDADGVRWAVDLGADSYGLPAYWGAKRWTYFRCNNYSHNTLTPGPSLQNPKAAAPIIAFESSPARAFAIIDLTAVYPDRSQKMLRGVAMLDRSRVLIQDDVLATGAGQVLDWRMLTAAQISLSADGRTATLSQQGKTLMAQILSPSSAVFRVGSAEPSSEQEARNPGISILGIQADSDGKDMRLAVMLTPGSSFNPAANAPALVPLEQWVTGAF